MREIIIDTETTGLDPNDGDRIIEIAAVEIINNIVTSTNYHVYIDPKRDIPDSAFKVHGLSREFLEGKPVFDDVVDEFLAFIGDDTLIAHNAEFDMRFINAELQRAGRPVLDKNPVIDTLALARRKHPGASNSLDALCARYGIDRSRRTKHGALIDSEILAEVYLELKVGRQSSLSFSAQKEIRKIDHSGLLTCRSEALASALTQDEIAGHEKLVEKMNGRSLWGKYPPRLPS